MMISPSLLIAALKHLKSKHLPGAGRCMLSHCEARTSRSLVSAPTNCAITRLGVGGRCGLGRRPPSGYVSAHLIDLLCENLILRECEAIPLVPDRCSVSFTVHRRAGNPVAMDPGSAAHPVARRRRALNSAEGAAKYPGQTHPHPEESG